MIWFPPRGPADLGEASADFDAPGPTPVRRLLVIASSQRTGSNLLCRALTATGQAGVPTEYLDPIRGFIEWRSRANLPQPTLRGRAGMAKRRVFGDPGWQMCYRWNQRSLERYLDWITQRRTTPNGVFAIKVHGQAFHDWTVHRHLDLARWRAPVSWVHLQREDRLAQAVSFAIALQTKQWTSSQRSLGSPVYDAALVDSALVSMQRSEDRWLRYFAEQGLQPLELTYERLVGDYESSVRAVLDLLGVEVESVPPPRLARQATGVNDEWIARFIEDCPDRAAAARGGR